EQEEGRGVRTCRHRRPRSDPLTLEGIPTMATELLTPANWRPAAKGALERLPQQIRSSIRWNEERNDCLIITIAVHVREGGASYRSEVRLRQWPTFRDYQADELRREAAQEYKPPPGCSAR